MWAIIPTFRHLSDLPVPMEIATAIYLNSTEAHLLVTMQTSLIFLFRAGHSGCKVVCIDSEQL